MEGLHHHRHRHIEHGDVHGADQCADAEDKDDREAFWFGQGDPFFRDHILYIHNNNSFNRRRLIEKNGDDALR